MNGQKPPRPSVENKFRRQRQAIDCRFEGQMIKCSRKYGQNRTTGVKSNQSIKPQLDKKWNRTTEILRRLSTCFSLENCYCPRCSGNMFGAQRKREIY